MLQSYYDLWQQKTALIVPVSIMVLPSEFKACERKRKEACSKGLKCLNKELLVALLNEFKLL